MPPVTALLADRELRRRAERIASTCTNFALRKAARAVTQLYDDMLRPSGLRSTQFTLLALLAGHGEMSVTELAKASATDRTTLTRNFALLERDGLVRVRPGDDDARVRLVTLSPAGRRRLLEAMPLWDAAQRRVVTDVGEGPLTTVRAALSGVVDAIAGSP
jgi:DNA-binding MarR family transcriptional regulator